MRTKHYFLETIRAGVESGEFEVEDVKLATLFVLSSLNWSYQWYDPAGEKGLDGLSDEYTTLIFNALNAK